MKQTDFDEWSDTADDIPTKKDFDPFNGDLDAMCAWEHFGGLTRLQAFNKFCEYPDYYQEDFMFMGEVAFVFYFPIIERYILESHIDNDDDSEVDAIWILAHCIKNQFEYSDTVRHLRQRCLDLTNHVRSNLPRYCTDLAEQQRIDDAWHGLKQFLVSCE